MVTVTEPGPTRVESRDTSPGKASARVDCPGDRAPRRALGESGSYAARGHEDVPALTGRGQASRATAWRTRTRSTGKTRGAERPRLQGRPRGRPPGPSVQVDACGRLRTLDAVVHAAAPAHAPRPQGAARPSHTAPSAEAENWTFQRTVGKSRDCPMGCDPAKGTGNQGHA